MSGCGMWGLLLFAAVTGANIHVSGSVEICKTPALTPGGAGDKGVIQSPGYPSGVGNKDWQKNDCVVSVTACPECKIVLNFTDVVLSPCNAARPQHGSCIMNCDHIYIQDNGYPTITTGYVFGGNRIDSLKSFESISRRIYIKFCHSTAHPDTHKRFRINYTIVEKLSTHIGSTPDVGYFTTPNFPTGYSRMGDVYQYYIHNNAGYIRLTFDDWNLSPNSKLAIFYHNSSHSRNFLNMTGKDKRPFVISSGHDLFIRFETGEDSYTSYIGFKARYEFVSDYFWPNKPYLDCGEYYHSLYGGMFQYETSKCWFGEGMDCIWAVGKYKDVHYAFQQVSLRIDDIDLFGEDSLELRSGMTSSAPLIVRYGADRNDGSASLQMVDQYSSTGGFYIRLRAKCSQQRRFRAVFASFTNATIVDYDHYRGKIVFSCKSDALFLCGTRRCISKTLTCDGIDHCGDNSDEQQCTTVLPVTPSLCNTHYMCRNGGGWYCISEMCDGKWDCDDGSDERSCYTSAPPETSPPYSAFSAYHWSTIIPIILICVVLAVIACVLVSYYTRRKTRNRHRRQRAAAAATSPAGYPTISGIFDYDTPLGIPYPDAPPTYEESLQFSHGQTGAVNMGYRTDSMDFLAQPPPYSIAATDPQPIQYRTPQTEGATATARPPGYTPTSNVPIYPSVPSSHIPMHSAQATIPQNSNSGIVRDENVVAGFGALTIINNHADVNRNMLSQGRAAQQRRRRSRGATPTSDVQPLQVQHLLGRTPGDQLGEQAPGSGHQRQGTGVSNSDHSHESSTTSSRSEQEPGQGRSRGSRSQRPIGSVAYDVSMDGIEIDLNPPDTADRSRRPSEHRSRPAKQKSRVKKHRHGDNNKRHGDVEGTDADKHRKDGATHAQSTLRKKDSFEGSESPPLSPSEYQKMAEKLVNGVLDTVQGNLTQVTGESMCDVTTHAALPKEQTPTHMDSQVGSNGENSSEPRPGASAECVMTFDQPSATFV